MSLQAKIGQAMTLHRQGDFAAAERLYSEILRQAPKNFDALHLLGVIAYQTRRTERGVALIRRAIRLNPAAPSAHNNLGNALRDMQLHDEALASYDRAISLKPDYAEAHYNRASTLKELKLTDAALESYDRAIELAPGDDDVRVDRSLCLLQLGRFQAGWREYESRKKPAPAAAPLWLGQPGIEHKTLFVRWEQGLGDTIQFCRYARLVADRGASVIMSVQQPLVELLTQIGPDIRIVGPAEVPASFDYYCPLMSLPLACGTTLQTVPAQHHYLKADAQRRRSWEARLPPKTKPRIGLVWSGRSAHKNDRNRSLELRQLLPIVGPDAEWFCLQKEIRASDRIALQQSSIANFSDDLRDFSDTAALVDLMDLVITVDTSVAHLAGAMGKPVWILLPYNPDWRWLLDRPDSPWYPSARLCRQQRPGHWDEVIDRIKAELPPTPG